MKSAGRSQEENLPPVKPVGWRSVHSSWCRRAWIQEVKKDSSPASDTPSLPWPWPAPL